MVGTLACVDLVATTAVVVGDVVLVEEPASTSSSGTEHFFCRSVIAKSGEGGRPMERYRGTGKRTVAEVS